jgi:Raf kinase inhibitor-like YbhB/YbcL family protein
MPMTLTSASFSNGGEIPRRCTCQGEDVSPPLAWSGVPAAARALALIVDDPDAPDPAAPRMTYVHWVLYNLAAADGGLPENVAPEALPGDARVGVNDWHRADYGGPCPPIGRHRYFFKLYALDAPLPARDGATKAYLEEAMRGHVLAEAQLMGTYLKTK